ncbi:hypothetical protein [Corallococcus llansteffanensis]|uniref:Uncharacterized protein n=1 Tax=Corallococcus llansteffanensis TaxID=2316731 RepID=A0A3A8QKH0_9BACT|nr:hypothetical protein [Corallococcus llansteffanensis]RKH68271.1 hypothetical protein D7V93_01515 [Corallococcus llansteffanensis]
MTAEERARQMMEYLPLLLRDGANIHRLFELLGRELEGMEESLTLLMHSRWYTLARGFEPGESLARKTGSELGRLAALFGLYPGRGESSDDFRVHMASLLAVHRTGLSTTPALLRLVSLVYRAAQPPRIEWMGDTAVGRFTVTSADGSARQLRVELADTPPTARRVQFLDVDPGRRLFTRNGGLETTIPELSLTATNDTVAVPIFTHQESGQDVIYLGQVPRGSTLLLRHGHAPLIDGVPSQEPLITANPTRFAGLNAVSPSSRFDGKRTQFSTANARDPQLPTLALGENHWVVGTLSQTELRSYLAGWTNAEAEVRKALPVKPAGLKVDLEFRWTELTPATFTLRIPVDYLPRHCQEPDEEGVVPGLTGLIRELSAALDYGRASGVRPRIELGLFMPAEQVEVTERSQMRWASTFSERLEPKETLSSFGPSLEFEEVLREPTERLTFSGFFDRTRMGGASFQ